MKIDKTNEALKQLINAPSPDNKKIKQMMTMPSKEVLQKSINNDGLGYVIYEKKQKA